MNNVEYNNKDLDMTQFARMSHPWVNGFHKLNLDEQLVILMALSKLEVVPKEQQDREVVFITTKDFAEIRAGSDGFNDADERSARRSMTRIHRASSNMLKKQVSWFDDDGIEHETNWLQDVVKKQDGAKPKGRGHLKTIGIQFTEKAIKNTAALTESYTLFDLYRIGKFNSIRTIRLFQLLMDRKSFGKVVISVEDLMYVLEVPASGSLARFSNFYQSVVLKAVAEIKEKDALLGRKLEPEKIKTGRRVTGIKFDFLAEVDFENLDKKWLLSEQCYESIFCPLVEASGLTPTNQWFVSVAEEFASYWLSDKIAKPTASKKQWEARFSTSVKKAIAVKNKQVKAGLVGSQDEQFELPDSEKMRRDIESDIAGWVNTTNPSMKEVMLDQIKKRISNWEDKTGQKWPASLVTEALAA